MKKLLLFLCLLMQVGFAQTQQLDSLKRELINMEKQPDGYAKDTLIYKTLKVIMNVYSNVNVDSSMHYTTRMLGLCEDQKLQKELIYAYQFAGYLYHVKGDYYRSIQFHNRALSLAEKVEQYTRMAVSYGGLAHAFISLKDYTEATKLCVQGLEVLRKHPDTDTHLSAKTQLSILNVLGGIYREQGNLNDALKVAQDMYKLALSEHNSWFESQGLHAIGWVYKEMGDMTRALNYSEKALSLSREINSVELEGGILLNITDLYIRQKKWRQALTYCTLAKQSALRVNNSSTLVEAEEKFYKIFRNTGKTSEALKSYENFVSLKDSLSKETNEQRIEALKAQRDDEQKENTYQEQRIQLLGLLLGIAAVVLVAALLFWNNRRLQAKNREIDRQRVLLETARQQLADSNKTLETRVKERTGELVTANAELIRKNEEIKGALFKGQTIERKRVAIELHDNLSSLLSAVNMSIQSINPKNLSESEQSVYRNVKLLIQNAYSEVRNISHNILPAELEKEGLVRTLTTLIGQFNQNETLQFALTTTSLTERLPIEIEFNVYSIVLELINNAIKHAKATLVGISLCRTDSGVDLSVTDDGIGLGQHNAARGVGLQNIQTRLETLGGTFDTVRPAEKGTRICIKIPIETVRANGNVNNA